MRFSASTRQSGAVTVVTIAGSIMYAEADALYDLFRDLLAKGQKSFLLNLSNVSHLDSSGIGALARTFVMVKKGGGDLKMVNLGKQVRRLMEITTLSTIFEDYSDEDDALQSFR